MSYLRIIVVDADIEGNADAVVRVLREVLAPSAVVAVANEQAVPGATKPAAPPPVARSSTSTLTPPVRKPEPAPVALVQQESGPETSIASHIIETYAAKPGATKAEVAKIVYGDSRPESVARLHTMIHGLMQRGKLRRVSLGRYEVVS